MTGVYGNSDAYEWDDEVRADNSEGPALLTPGVAYYRVTDMVRGTHNGSAKIGPCKKAVLTLEVQDLLGKSATFETALFLTHKLDYLITAFGRSSGLVDESVAPGGVYVFPWSKVVGTQGLCEVGTREFRRDSGETSYYNQIKRWLYGEKAKEAARKLAQASRNNGATYGQATPTWGARQYGDTF